MHQVTVPTKNEFLLYSAIASALDKELFYTTDVYAHVVEEMSAVLTPEILAQNSKTMPNENGHFGMDIYNMRKIVEKWMKLQADKEALASLDIKVGDRFTKFKYGLTNYSSFTINSINEANGTVELHCKKRGNKGVFQYMMPANDPTFIAFMQEKTTPKNINVTEFDNRTEITIDLGHHHSLKFEAA